VLPNRIIYADHMMSRRNPHEKKFKSGSKYLEPRDSFQRWSETIIGVSKEWTDDQRKLLVSFRSKELTSYIVDSASILAMLYGGCTDIFRQKGPESQSLQLSMIRTSSREGKFQCHAMLTQDIIAVLDF
jgi:hypothetical protein